MNTLPFDLKKMVSFLLINVIILFTGILIWANQQNSFAQPMDIDSISRQVEINKDLFKINKSSQASIQKVTSIISRYNRDMNATLKSKIANEVYAMSLKYPNLNVDFISATITHESAKTWEPTITSRVGAMGLMQIMPATGAFLAIEEGIEWTGTESVLYHPLQNIRLGCRYLSHLVTMYDHDGALAAYNSGPRRAEMWLESNRNNQVLYAETRSYIPAVLKLYDEFREQDIM